MNAADAASVALIAGLVRKAVLRQERTDVNGVVPAVSGVRPSDELLTRADVARIAGVSRTKSFEIWALLDKIVLGGRCVRVRRADLERYFDEVRRRAWR